MTAHILSITKQGTDDLEIPSQHLFLSFLFFLFLCFGEFFLDCLLLCAPGAISPPVPARRRREMKLGFVLHTAVALYLLLSPAQVGRYIKRNFMPSQKRRLYVFLSRKIVITLRF